MTTTQRLGIELFAVDKTAEAFAHVKKFTDELQAVPRAVRGFSAPMAQAERNTAQLGSRIQNASYQISDFAVQMSSGTDAARALAQQLPQVLGGFGVFGGVAGAAVAIILPLAAALGKTRDYAGELAGGLDRLEAAQKTSTATLVDLTEEYGRYAGVIRDVARTQEELAKIDIARALVDQAKAIGELNSAYVGTAGAFGEVVNQWRNADFGRSAIAQLFSPLDEAANKVNFLKDKFSLTEQAARGVVEPFNAFQIAVSNTNTEAAAAALEQFNAWIVQNRDNAASAIPLLDAMNRQFAALSKLSPVNSVQQVTSGLKQDFGVLGSPNETVASKVGGSDSEAVKAAASAAKKAATEYQNFLNVVGQGVTPLQHMQETLRQAELNFARFGDRMNPAQVAAYGAYIADLNVKIDDLTFKGKWDEMAKGIQTATDAMTPFRSMMEDIGQSVEDSFVNGISGAFTSFIDGSESAQEALRNFAASFAKEMSAMIAKALVLFAVQKLIGMASGSMAFGSFMQSHGGVYGKGGVFSSGQAVKAFASGGIVGGPTFFPMAGGRTGLMGEAGPEAIVPLSRRNGRLGVGASPVNVSINNYAGAEVRTRQGADGRLQIDLLKKELALDIRRGGNDFASAFESGFGLRRAGR